MQRQFTSGSRQAPDPFDQFLEDNNYYRKHTARDASCLFRVISEQMYDTQLHHLAIRKKCVNYMRKHHQFFQPLVEKDLDEYLDDMSKPKTYGTLVELQAVGYMFQRNVVLFQPFDLGKYFNTRSYFKEVFLVFYTPERHFDSVFTCDYIKDAAICQSICYEILYKDLYKLPDVSYAVEQMLHSSTFEETDYRSETNKDGYCTGIQLSDGSRFEFDLPNDTCCILENYKLCHFHYTNFPRLSDDLQREMKNSNNRGDEQDKNALNKTAESLLPDKFISCVRQLLKEGITPFPYKVAKALDPNMYRNIEFDSWNEARKELKLQHWYNGDSNFKVGAKCHVKLRKSENDLYTCHIQEIAVDKGYCIVFIEQLGEKRLVPYDSLTPLPPDEFKPWTIPYRLQRHMQKYSSFRYTRHYNCFKFNGQFSSHEYCSALPAIKSDYYDAEESPKQTYAVASQSVPHHNNCFYKLKQYTHLENFRTQTVEYCTMPLTVEHGNTNRDNEQKTPRSNAALHEHLSRTPSRSSVTTDVQSKQEFSNCMEDPTQHGDGVMEPFEIEQNGYMPEMHCFYPVHPYGGPEEYYTYGYDGNLHPATLLPANTGGTIYYTCAPAYPPPNNLYLQAPPPLPQPHQAVIAPSGASTAPGATYYHPNPYAPAVLSSAVTHQTNLNTPPIIARSVTPSTRGGRGANGSNGRVNLDAKKSAKSNGSDLPVDVVTLRYFYNLGIEYHNRHVKNNSSEASALESKDNIVKLSTDLKNMNIDGNCNQSDMKYDSNNNNLTANAANSSNNTNSSSNPQQNQSSNLNKANSQQRRFSSRYFNSKEQRQAYQRNNNTVLGTASNPNTRNNNAYQNDHNKNQTARSLNANSGNSNSSSAGVNNSRNHHQNNSSASNANSAANNVVLAVPFEPGNQTSPIASNEVLMNGADVIQNATAIYNPNTNPFITYGCPYEYNGDQNGQCSSFGPPPPPGGVFIQMPMAPSPYGIYTAPPPPNALGIPHMAGAYSPYMAPPPPTGGSTIPMSSPMQGPPPHQSTMPPPTSMQASNGFYATISNGSEPIESNGILPEGGLHYQCMNYPPPVSFIYSPNATNVGGVGSNSNTTSSVPNQHQPVVGGLAGSLPPSAMSQQGYWCVPPPAPQGIPPGTQIPQSNGPANGGSCNNAPNSLIQSNAANIPTTQNRREKQYPNDKTT